MVKNLRNTATISAKVGIGRNSILAGLSLYVKIVGEHLVGQGEPLLNIVVQFVQIRQELKILNMWKRLKIALVMSMSDVRITLKHDGAE